MALLILAISLVAAMCSSANRMSTDGDLEHLLRACAEALLRSLEGQVL